MTAHQINLSIFPTAEALPDSRLNASRIEFAVRTGAQTPSAPAKGDKTKVRLHAPPKTDRNIDGGQEAGEGIGPEVARLLGDPGRVPPCSRNTSDGDGCGDDKKVLWLETA